MKYASPANRASRGDPQRLFAFAGVRRQPLRVETHQPPSGPSIDFAGDQQLAAIGRACEIE